MFTIHYLLLANINKNNYEIINDLLLWRLIKRNLKKHFPQMKNNIPTLPTFIENKIIIIIGDTVLLAQKYCVVFVNAPYGSGLYK